MPGAVADRSTRVPAELHRRQAWLALAIAIAATFAVHRIAWLRELGLPLLLASTLAHELGHGLTAIVLGGEFERLLLWWNGSGVAEYSGRFSRLSLAAISAGGLLGPPIAAFGLLLAGRRSVHAHVALALLAVLLALAGIVWAGNLLAIGTCLLFAAVLGLLAWKASKWLSQIVCVFLAVQLALASFSRGDYLFTAQAVTGRGAMPSDVAQIAAALWLPYWFWGTLIALLSLGLLALGAWRFARSLA